MEVNRPHPVFSVELVDTDPARASDVALVTCVELFVRDHGVPVIRDRGPVGYEAHVRFLKRNLRSVTRLGGATIGRAGADAAETPVRMNAAVMA